MLVRMMINHKGTSHKNKLIADYLTKQTEFEVF